MFYTPLTTLYAMTGDGLFDDEYEYSDDFPEENEFQVNNHKESVKSVKCNLTNMDDEEKVIHRPSEKKRRHSAMSSCFDLVSNMDIKPSKHFGMMDMNERENDYELAVDIPGMKKEDIKIHCKDNSIVIEGERKEEKVENGKVYRKERYVGKFYQSYSLPKNGDEENVTAVYEDGVLRISIPKKEVVDETKYITVN